MKKYLAMLAILAFFGGVAANTKAVTAYNNNILSRDTIPADTLRKHKMPGKMKRDTSQWPKDTMPHSLPPR
jgi:hypothetical protein